MGRKLDLSGLTDDEAEHVLKVVQRDMKLRKKEEERLSEMKQELDEEGSRCSILSKQNKFNEHCCIRCCSPFTFLLNPKRQCLDCQFYVCKGCRIYCKKDKAWLCSACEKSRVLRTQSLEWYYNNVKSRFKRFGSAKVLKTLYRKHIAERGALSEFTEGSFHEGSIDNEGSVCGSDSTFYRQSEGHSMADTLTVALRVAEEAIEEAIAKAEEYSDSLEKQNEARYLRDNKEELIEELATTIVQKIIQRRKRSEMQAEYEMVWPATQNQNQSSEPPSPTPPQPSPHTVQASLKTSYSLWRSRSAFSLTSDDSPEKPTEPGEKAGGPEAAGKGGVKEYASLKKEARAAQMTSWKSVDRLDNSCASSVLQSPDGNWIALQSTQLSRPSLLTKRKSLVFSVLEKESGVVSAYDEMGSDTEDEDPGGWVSALHRFRRKMSDETYYTDSQHDPEWTYTQNPAVTSPSSGQYTNTETLNSDSEPSPVPSSARDGPPKHRKHLLSVLKRKGGPDHHHHHLHHPHPHQLDALDINFNPKVAGGPGGGTGPEDSSEAEDRHSDHIRRSRRRRKSKREQAEPGRSLQPQYSSSVPEYSSFSLSSMARRELEAGLPPPPDTVTPDTLTSEAVTPSAGSREAGTAGSRAFCAPEALELELKSKLRELVRRASDQELTSSEDDSPQRAGDRRAEGQGETPSEGERESACDQEADRHAKREEERLKEKSLERAGERLGKKEGDGEEGIVEEEEEVLGEMLQKEEVQREEEREGERDSEVTLGQAEQEAEGTGATHPLPESAPYVQEEILSADDIRKKYSAASLCSITTEVLKVLNATEELIEGAGGEGSAPPEPADPSPLPSGSSSKKLDEHLTKLEENVYLAAGTVYGLEGELGDLEECARAISSGTTEKELAYLEDQVASAAAQVQQSELQISDIEARISALKTAGLNVTACTRFSKFKPKPKPETIGSSRQQRRKLPAPPLKGVTR